MFLVQFSQSLTNKRNGDYHIVKIVNKYIRHSIPLLTMAIIKIKSITTFQLDIQLGRPLPSIGLKWTQYFAQRFPFEYLMQSHSVNYRSCPKRVATQNPAKFNYLTIHLWRFVKNACFILFISANYNRRHHTVIKLRISTAIT